MDRDGERKIHAGDKYTIQTETYDLAEVKSEIADLVTRPKSLAETRKSRTA